MDDLCGKTGSFDEACEPSREEIRRRIRDDVLEDSPDYVKKWYLEMDHDHEQATNELVGSTLVRSQDGTTVERVVIQEDAPSSTRYTKSKPTKSKNGIESDTDIESGSEEGGKGGHRRYRDIGLEELPSNVIMISGCQDHQTSADVSNVSSFSLPDANGKAGGACTSALLNVLYADHKDPAQNLSFAQVIKGMRSFLLRAGYSQIPQLTSSRRMNMHQPFYICPPHAKTKRAVLIGINYYLREGQLSGCINDCLNMKDYIQNVWGFPEENITVLADDGYHKPPTRNNILRAYQRVVKMSQNGDAIFCHYSGHGGRVRDDDIDEEEDGYDETIVPVDFATSGQIRDDDLYQNLVGKLPEGVSLVSLMDCCHSGSVLDLPFKYQAVKPIEGGIQSLRHPNEKCGLLSVFLALFLIILLLLVGAYYGMDDGVF